jgi:hypothetical protein
LIAAVAVVCLLAAAAFWFVRYQRSKVRKAIS